MNIIVLNGLRFVAPLKALGHTVRSFGELQGCDQRLAIAGQSIDNVLQLAGFVPDLILIEIFGGAAPFFRGLERCPYPLAAYAVDTTINLFWMRHYLALFDAVFVDQADAAYHLRRSGIRATWLPLAIDPQWYPTTPQAPEYDIVFVGRITPGRAKRHNLIQLLQKHYPVHVVGRKGDPWLSEQQMARLFAKARIVLNENLFNGVTLRVFQGLASGSMLLTEEAGNGLHELFEDNRHLVTFTPETLLEKAGYFLGNEDQRRAIAQAGQDVVLAQHTLLHRVETILDGCSALVGTRPPRPLPYRFSASAATYALLAERFSSQAQLFLPRAEQASVTVLQNQQASRRTKAQTYEYLGRCLATSNHPQDALKSLFEATRLAPRNPSPCFLLGHLLLHLEQKQQAVSFFSSGLKRLDCPKQDLVHTAEKLTATGRFDSPELWSAFAKVMAACDRIFEPGHIKQAAVLFPETAVEYLELALQHGGGVEILQELATCYELVGIWDHAYEYLLKALEQNPTDKILTARCNRAHALCYSPQDPLFIREKAMRLQQIRSRA